MRNAINLLSVKKITATGGLPDTTVGNYGRFGTIRLKAANDAGTNPTLDIKVQSSDPAVTGYNYLTAGTTETKLKTGASTLVKHALTFTQTGARSIKTASFVMKKIGSIAAGKKVTIEVQSDSAGAPSGSVLGSATIDIDTAVGTAFAYVKATFETPVDVANSTKYHLVVSADYDASSDNCVVLRSATVSSGGTQQTYGSSWTAVTTQSYEAFVEQCQFTDLATFTQVTGTSNQEANVSMEATDAILRAYATIGGTNTPAFYVSLDLIAETRYS